MNPRIIGLTGGIATGKSEVARCLRDRGIAVIDADQLARQVVQPGQPGLEAVVRLFGKGVLHADGTLNRTRLAELIFAHPGERHRLEQVLHPLIHDAFQREAQHKFDEGHDLVVYEAPLLVERNLADRFRPLVVTTVNEQVQIERIRRRDAITREEALQRIRAQMPQQEKVAVADFVIDTSGTLDDVRVRTNKVLAAIREEAGHEMGS